MLVLGSHYPSDVVGGFCRAGWNCLAAALRAEALPSLRTLAAGPALGIVFLYPRSSPPAAVAMRGQHDLRGGRAGAGRRRAGAQR